MIQTPPKMEQGVYSNSVYTSKDARVLQLEKKNCQDFFFDNKQFYRLTAACCYNEYIMQFYIKQSLEITTLGYMMLRRA